MARQPDEAAPARSDKSDPGGHRAAGRAASLRANLQRRKRQERARAESHREHADQATGGETEGR